MQVSVFPSIINGAVCAAASKSAMQRACAAALLFKGATVLENAGVSNDDLAAIGIIKALGATVEEKENEIIINSNGVHPFSGSFHCGESGLSIRMFSPIAALSSKEITITGSGSLATRPMNFFDEVLPQLNVSVKSNNGFLPLHVTGPLIPKNITIDGSLSSQYITGLLFAYSAAGARNVTINVTNLNSKPYIDLTLKIMERFGLKTPVHTDYTRFYFDDKEPKEIADKTVQYTVEGDWSGAAFLLVAGAIGGAVEVTGLDVFSSQADKAILQALMQSGAVISISQEKINVSKAPLKAFQFDATHCPDLFPPLVALAAFCSGTSVIEGVNRLTHKESNRALTLQQEFGRLGIEITLQDNLMLVKGGQVKSANVHSHHDHRIAMACAVAALGGDGKTIIEAAEVIDKSYPVFYNHLQQLGAHITFNK